MTASISWVCGQLFSSLFFSGFSTERILQIQPHLSPVSIRLALLFLLLTRGALGSKCNAPLNGPNATGDHCPEGWAFYKYPGPGFDGFPNTSAETSYYTWVDQHNTLGLGNDVPISTANLEDGFVAFKDGNMVLLRIPYPMGFYAKGLDGRINGFRCRLERPRTVEHQW